MPDVTVIIPAYNEEKSIGGVIDSIRATHPSILILVGDNNCEDRTAEIAKSKGCSIVAVAEQGKGATIRRLIQEVGSVYTIMTDADGTYPVSECIDYFGLLLKHTDVVVGRRKWYGKEAMSRLHRVGNKSLSLIAESVYLRPVGDLCSGLWGFRTSSLKKLDITSKGFDLEADMFSLAVKMEMSITYVPVPYYPREESKSSLKISDGVRIARRLLVNRFRR